MMKSLVVVIVGALLLSSSAGRALDVDGASEMHSLIPRVLGSRCTGIALPVEAVANAGDASALQMMGILYDRGCGVPQNMPKALEYFERASRKNPNDSVSSGYVALYERKNEPDASGIALMTKAAEAGNVFAETDLEYYFDHRFVEPSDYEKAIHWGKLASDAGDILARAELSVDYEYSTDAASADKDLAKDLLQQAYDANEPLAIAIVGGNYMQGSSGYPKDWERGYALIKKSIGLGSARAKLTLYRSLDQSDVEAGRISAAEVDALLPDAASRLFPKTFVDIELGRALLGLDAKRPECAKAIPLLEEGIDLDDPFAPLNLAYCYYYGLGVPVDRQKGIMYEKMAAAKGSPEAIAFLKGLEQNGNASGNAAADYYRNYEGYNWSKLHPMSGPPH